MPLPRDLTSSSSTSLSFLGLSAKAGQDEVFRTQLEQQVEKAEAAERGEGLSPLWKVASKSTAPEELAVDPWAEAEQNDHPQPTMQAEADAPPKESQENLKEESRGAEEGDGGHLTHSGACASREGTAGSRAAGGPPQLPVPARSLVQLPVRPRLSLPYACAVLRCWHGEIKTRLCTEWAMICVAEAQSELDLEVSKSLTSLTLQRTC